MTEATKYIGARLPEDIFKLVEETAEEEHIDRSNALRELINLGRQRKKEERAVLLYREGKVSCDKAAEIAGLTVTEMMTLLGQAGLRSEQTLAEYREGLQHLLKRK